MENWEKEFDEQFGDWIINDDVEFRDHGLSDKIKKFIKDILKDRSNP